MAHCIRKRFFGVIIMSSISFTASNSTTFNVTHARHITARVKSDLKRLNQLYPSANLSDKNIGDYHEEATTLLKDGLLATVTYGFKKEVEDWFGNKKEEWILALKYEAVNGMLDGGSEVPGGLKSGCDVSGAKFCSFLTYSDAWEDKSAQQKSDYKRDNLPFQRTSGTEPSADWSQDRSYGNGGRVVNRYSTYPG